MLYGASIEREDKQSKKTKVKQRQKKVGVVHRQKETELTLEWESKYLCERL